MSREIKFFNFINTFLPTCSQKKLSKYHNNAKHPLKDPKNAQISLLVSLEIATYIPFKGNIRALYSVYSLQREFKEKTRKTKKC